MKRKKNDARGTADGRMTHDTPVVSPPPNDAPANDAPGGTQKPKPWVSGSGHEAIGPGGEKSAAEPASEKFLIVGIGASAGGLEAIERFFRATPPNSGMAYVVVQHLAMQRESIMAELIARFTSLPCEQVVEPTLVRPNQIYLIPPDATLTIRRGTLIVHKPAEAAGHRSPIDLFFASLADDQGKRAAAVVLSGAGSDGSLGIKAIKEHGGLVVAQSDAKHDSMPRHAVATGVVDYVLAVDQIPSALMEFARYDRELERERLPNIMAEITRGLPELTTLLRRKTGHDFSQYKPNTIVRRTQRRMQLLRIEAFDEYLKVLNDDPGEAEVLFKDLLIGVTYFFRDQETFAKLKSIVIPELFAGKDAGETVRVWVPGCATGEESYSIAILLREHMSKLDVVPKAQIFASDIDAEALNIGRAGMYAASITEQVTPERLERFFVKQESGYKLNKDVRDMCLFSMHNLIKDPPFSRLDLLSCRNVLIYMHAELQRRLLQLFHYAMRPGGFLFLGPSESVAGHSELFEVMDKSAGIYRRREQAVQAPLDFPITADSRFSLLAGERQGGAKPTGADIPRAVERLLLAGFAPACVVVNNKNEVVYFAGHTGKYLEHPPGHPTHDIMEMARRGLRMDLKSTLHEARQTHNRVRRPGVRVQTNGHVMEIELEVQPLAIPPGEAAYYLIVFKDAQSPAASQGPDAPAIGASSENVRALEDELSTTKQHLQSTVEELEASNEELKSMNEELLSLNEELQSTNEELETSREELQSVNEELETVNGELAAKVRELGRANDNLRNLLDSTQVATIFLDSSLRIRGFTPAITEIFSMIDSDVGRPITDLASRYSLGDLMTDARLVLRSLTPRERSVKIADHEDSWHLMRVLPYRTQDNVIDGVVVTFVDIRAVKRAEEALKETAARFRSISDSGMISIAFFEANGTITEANSAFLKMMGYSQSDVAARVVHWDRLCPPESLLAFRGVIDELIAKGAVQPREQEFVRRDGSRFRGLFGCAQIDGGKHHDVVGFVLEVPDTKE